MYELVLRGGVVHDGLGTPGREADLALAGGRVAAVGRGLGPARRLLDVTGLLVAPGFVDPHAHSDTLPLQPAPQPFKLLQGVTTEVVGNCGFSAAPLTPAALPLAGELFGDLAAGVTLEAWSFGEYLARLEAAGPSNHLALLVGHHTLRLCAVGMGRAAAAGAVARMVALAEASFAAGAAGLSSGLFYAPGAWAPTAEVAALAAAAARHGRPYATHLRDEAAGLLDALDEAVAIGRSSGARVQVSHVKAAGRAQHGRAGAVLQRLAAARAGGVDVRGDAYPYTAGSTFLSALLPPEALDGGVGALRARLAAPAERARLRRRAERGGAGSGLWPQVAPDGVLVVNHADAAAVGRTLAHLAGPGEGPFEAACRLIAADPGAHIVAQLMDEADVDRILADPLIAVGSDSDRPTPMAHPRVYGCFPRFLERFVRARPLLSWEEALRKCTSAAADAFGLADRGRLEPGAAADVVVLDPATIGHAGTYAVPAAAPSGVRHVLLDGRLAVEDGTFTGMRLGRVLRPQPGRSPAAVTR